MVSSHPSDMQQGKKDAGFALQTISILWQQKLETNVHISLVRPHLEYAAQVWDPHLQQNTGDNERFQKFALMIILF